LDRIEKASASMQAIIDGFLSLQTVRSTTEGQLQIFPLETLISQIIEQSIFSAQNKGITMVANLPAGSLRVLGHLAHTHQILTNYVTNAIKYSPRNTQTQIRARQETGHWRVEIQDQGPGIALSERHKLFVEFARISNKPTGGERSTGLGLAIVKALAEAQQARVGADFPPEGGSLFWIEIPTAEDNVSLAGGKA
jgi:signal transduction histidine kinase